MNDYNRIRISYVRYRTVLLPMILSDVECHFSNFEDFHRKIIFRSLKVLHSCDDAERTRPVLFAIAKFLFG